MTRKSKYATGPTDANGGVHSIRQAKHVHDLLRNHGMKNAALFQLVLTGFDTIKQYQKAIKAIVEKIRDHGCRCEYYGAFELDTEKWKSLHAHLYLLIETAIKLPFGILDVREDKWLDKMAKKWGMNRPHLSKPKNKMHRTNLSAPMFARPNRSEECLEDCIKWSSYSWKVRSKDGVPSREKYFNSTVKANKAKQEAILAQAVAAAEVAIEKQTVETIDSSTTDKEIGENMELTSSQKYIASLYERAVDKQLDVLAIRQYLADKGLIRSQAQVNFELENTYGFYGYVASHQPPPTLSQAEFDRIIDKSDQPGFRLPASLKAHQPQARTW